MKVLLINLPNRYWGKSRTEIFFPSGLGYIAGTLLDGGHEVAVLDIYALDLTDDEVVRYVKNADFDVIGISAMSTQYNYVKWLSSIIREIHPQKRIILGWVLATHSAETVLKNTDVDICVIGEGEITIKKLLLHLTDLKQVNGIAFKEEDRVIRTQPRTYIESLDSLPKIPYGLFPMEVYIESLSKNQADTRSINLCCGRGCPYSCTFCSKSFTGVRLRSIDDVIDEIIFLKDEYQINRIHFTDELLVIGRKRIMSFCDRLMELKITWTCQGRINHVDEAILAKMKAAGCLSIGYGVESGSQKILDAMDKKIDILRAEEVIRITKRIGITPVLQFIFGYPGEDMGTIRETIDFFKRIDEGRIEFAVITPLPGTVLWDHCLGRKVISDETKYLERLEGGYWGNAPLLVNLTSFSDQELTRLRKWAEKTIMLNHIRRHPFNTLKKMQTKLKTEGFRTILQRAEKLLLH